MSSIYLVVGHRNAGKSTTIRALFGKRGWFRLAGRKVFIRVMSNCDDPGSYADFVKKLEPRTKPYVVMAYCPESPPHPHLAELQKRYSVRAWVLATSPGGGIQVSPNEIAQLRQLGVIVGVTGLVGAGPQKYAGELRDFIGRNP